MKCPHCNSNIEYTRKMYWTRRIGVKIKCMTCDSDFKIIVSFRYYFCFALWSAAALGIGLLNKLAFSGTEYEHANLLVLLFMAAIIWVYWDRKLLNESETVLLEKE